MFILAKTIYSPHDSKQTKHLIAENFDQSIKNEFFISEALIEKAEPVQNQLAESLSDNKKTETRKKRSFAS